MSDFLVLERRCEFTYHKDLLRDPGCVGNSPKHTESRGSYLSHCCVGKIWVFNGRPNGRKYKAYHDNDTQKPQSPLMPCDVCDDWGYFLKK